MSDSHGRFLPVRQAVDLFDRLGVEQLIHCGDVGGEVVFDELAGRRVTFVWGNTDVTGGPLIAYLESLGLAAPREVPTRLTVDGREIAVFHGHEAGFETAAQRLAVNYILHGHTHQARDERQGNVRIVNPGALHRAKRLTVATLDLASDTLTFHEVSGKS
ncbi:MAG: metallophosphoesterase family protein [Planctomycetes bacterium]|nr:metallophosphoesterase family protein [Planctomycetota bacterium]